VIVTTVFWLLMGVAVILPVALAKAPVPPVTFPLNVWPLLLVASVPGASTGLRDRIQAVIFAYEAGVIMIGSPEV
jgi:hypothetical protein